MEATVYANNRFVELKKAISRTDDELKVLWHSKHLIMLLASGKTEEEAHKEATVYSDDRFVELKKAVSRTYEEWYDGWHSKHLEMLLASGMTEVKAHKEATVYADNQIAAMSRSKISVKGAQPPTDVLNCKHCLKLYMSEQTLNEHLNKEGCHLNGDFSMDLLNTDGRIGIYLPEARKVRIAQFHAKRKIRVWRKVVVRRTKRGK